MFDPATQTKLEDAWLLTLKLLAQTEITWNQAKAPNSAATFFAAQRFPGAQDTEIINAYGYGSVIVVAEASNFIVPPEKFDTLTSAAGVFTIQAAHQRIVGNKVSYWQLFASGK